jgi:hypothetical protein
MEIFKRLLPIMFSFALICLMTWDLYAQAPPPQAPSSGPGVSGPPPPGPPRQNLPAPTLKDLEGKESLLKKVSPGVFRLGDIEIIKADRSITFPAQVNMNKGLLEYLLVHNSGKTHESLFRTQVRPYDLQLAFLLLGYKTTDKPLRFQGDPDKPKGEPLAITITYNNAEGKSLTINPEEWIVKMNQNKSQTVKKMDWVFTGSIVANGHFLAQSQGSIIAIFHDPIAMIDNVTPGGESDKMWFAKEGTIPPPGTPVTLTIKSKK